MLRYRLIQLLCAFIAVMSLSSATLADSTTITSTSVTLQGNTDGTGCAFWLEPTQPIRFGVLATDPEADRRWISREFSLRIVNGRDVLTSMCTVTAGGSPFFWNGEQIGSIHTLKLSQSTTTAVPVSLLPQVNDLAPGELQSILVRSPRQNCRAIVVATLDLWSLPVLPANAVILGTLTLTMSDVAP